MLSRFVVASGLVLAILGVIRGVTVARLIYGLKRTDPYPAFMADYRLNVPGTYQKAKGTTSMGSSARHSRWAPMRRMPSRSSSMRASSSPRRPQIPSDWSGIGWPVPAERNFRF